MTQGLSYLHKRLGGVEPFASFIAWLESKGIEVAS